MRHRASEVMEIGRTVENRHGHGEAVYLGGQRERRKRPQEEELSDAESARHGRRVGGETNRADALHHLAAGDEIDRVARGAGEAKTRAEREIRARPAIAFDMTNASPE